MNRLANELIIETQGKLDQMTVELAKTITGQKEIIHSLIVCLVARGHALLEGMPGLAKTLLAKSIASAVEVPFQRIQFTPDLLPSDIVGTVIFNPQTTSFEIRKGPVFTGILLADEINRSPAKVQSALLQAMEERSVTIGDTTFHLEEPFLVLATENPIDQEGTYQLPEALMDRFLIKILMNYPEKNEEVAILNQHGNNQMEIISPVLTAEEIRQFSDWSEKVHVEERLKEYIVSLVRYTRPGSGDNDVTPYIRYGASPRASLALLKTARVNAIIAGRDHVLPEDIKRTAVEVLRHRILLSYEALAEDITTDALVKTALDTVALP